jgi:antitoxin CptB
MDQTPQPPALDARRRRLLFRAQHRGTRETDLLVGGYVAARIGSLGEAELCALEGIMDLPDPLLADWLLSRAEIPAQAHYATLVSMRDAAEVSATARKAGGT